MYSAPTLRYAYDAFISYSRRDSDAVDAISRMLEDDEGLVVWRDVWELAGGDDWLDALPEAITRSKALVAFIGPNGLGPWHREEIKIALMRAVEEGSIRVIPTILPGAEFPPKLPEFLRSRQAVDLRSSDSWSVHLLRCAIVGARPGRRDTFKATSTLPAARLVVHEWDFVCTRSDYILTLRVANPVGSRATLIIRDGFVRTLKSADHPIADLLGVYLAPIGRTRVPDVIRVPRELEARLRDLAPHRQLSPGEVEDIEFHVQPPPGLRAVISFGLHWQIADEPLYRATETGFLAIGQRGREGIPPGDSDSYSPGQHNFDKPLALASPSWPPGWPENVSDEEWRFYGAGEESSSHRPLGSA